ncbi:hypothetical protein ACI75Y_12980, partial [Capnocytophaga stomatis]|uniref:hypothetical protein n=1 Tax=Capnocytophaga stomatis TaxID=1848904 RepID=UPI00385D5415
AVAADALGLLAKSSGVGILLSTFAKMTLDVMQTPVKEFFEDMRNASVKEMNFEKFKGAENIRLFIQNDNFLRDIYFTDFIENETMQRLLAGQIKKQGDLKLGYGKVMIIYRKIEEGILIDSFFINMK